ncbi:MAG: sulfatase [Roseibacillus sp.]
MTLRLLCLLLSTATLSAQTKPNILFILSDDHRYDLMGFHKDAPEWLETPAMDRLAKEGAHLANAFVTTSLCSPSRASILTGQYMHHHRVVDNQRPVPKGTVFFPQHLQKNGYQTGFIGKWHMGHDNDEPRPGFHHWVSFKGQGTYFDPELNINGKRETFNGYNADILTDQAIKWLSKVGDPKSKSSKPFLLYLSYKAVHYPFTPAARHAKRYQGKKIPYPATMANTEENYATQPRWVRERRYGIHGIDHMQTGPLDHDPVPDFDELYYNFCETIHGLDENIGRVLKHLDQSGLTKNTLVIYMGDNGFALGEHGFYDKRDAFEESIRVPMLARGPGIAAGIVIKEMVQNIDIAPTLLDAAGAQLPPGAPKLDGRSFLPLLRGKKPSRPWRDHILYEYHWEWNFPACPTTLAIRTSRWKYVYTHGLWDINGLYDLETDPHERHNLINVPAFQEQAEALKNQLFEELTASGGLTMPIRPPAGDPYHDRKLQR